MHQRSSKVWLWAASLAICAGAPGPAHAVVATGIQWISQLDNASTAAAPDVAVHGSGDSFLLFNRQISAGAPAGDFFVVKRNTDGTTLWTRQVGSAASDVGRGIAVDAAGNSFVAGTTQGALGAPPVGSLDAFLTKIGGNGSVAWSRQFGSGAVDFAYDVAADANGSVALVGDTTGALTGANLGGSDAWIAKYSTAGDALWTRQFGTSSADSAQVVGADPLGNFYVAGETRGNVGGSPAGDLDVFLTKFDPDGNRLWSRQLGSKQTDTPQAMAFDASGNVYLTGETRGALAADPFLGEIDAFAAKFDSAGNRLWTRQWGTAFSDSAEGASVDALGAVIVAGTTTGNFAPTAAGNADANLARLSPAGDLLWTAQLGTSARDFGTGLGVDATGNMYLAGGTEGAFGAANPSGQDSYLLKYQAIPEPATLGLILAMTCAACGWRGRRSRRPSHSGVATQST